MTDESRVDVQPKYFGNVLSSFENGVQMDLRVKLAVEFIKGGAIIADGADSARTSAVVALDVATALLEESAARGLLKAMPEDGELSGPLKRHIERNARAQVFGQVAGQRAIREEAGSVMPAGASAMHPGMMG